MNPEERLQAIQQLRNLPTLPTVFHTVLQAIDDPKGSAGTLHAAIVQDPALATKILSAANSAYYGGNKRIVDLEKAIVTLGLDAVKQVALSISVYQMFPADGKVDEFDRMAFWVHSIGCATAAFLVATHSGLVKPEQGYLFGLLHDLGKVILDHYFHGEYQDVIVDARFNRISTAESEQRSFQLTHGQVGGVLCTRWNLPLVVKDVIEYHHDPASAPARSMAEVAVTHLADYLTHRCDFGNSGSYGPPFLDDSVLKTLRMQQSDVDTLMDTLRTHADEIAEIERLLQT